MIDRRDFVRSSAVAALAFAAACKKNPSVVATPGSLDAIQAGREQKIDMQWSGVEVIPKPGDRLTFTLAEPGTRTPLQGATGSIWMARDRATVASGPFQIRPLANGFEGLGLYVAEVDVPAEGSWTALVDAVVPGSDGQIGAASVLVGSTNQQVKQGERAVRIATPTSSDPRGVDPYCTNKPKPCRMHSISLDAALKSGTPTVVIIATPAFCTSKLCGPEVSMLEEVARRSGTGANFIHIENYKDDKPDTIRRQILSPAAAAWKLETEPATYWIGVNGIVRERALGPTDLKGFLDATSRLIG